MSTLRTVALKFEALLKTSAILFTPVECSCGNKWYAESPKGRKHGPSGRPNLTCPKCGERGFGQLNGKSIIKSEPEVQSPDLPTELMEEIKTNIPYHASKLGPQIKPMFQTGDRVMRGRRSGYVLDPVVHSTGPRDMTVGNLVSVQFDDVPFQAGYVGKYQKSSFEIIPERELVLMQTLDFEPKPKRKVVIDDPDLKDLIGSKSHGRNLISRRGAKEEEEEYEDDPDYSDMTYAESAVGIIINKERAIREILDHGDRTLVEEFLAENGDHKTYKASDVLTWLGY